jgi:hypothetical protein
MDRIVANLSTWLDRIVGTLSKRKIQRVDRIVANLSTWLDRIVANLSKRKIQRMGW